MSEYDAWAEQIRENSARHALVYQTFTTVGYGAVVFEDPVDFGLWFTELPSVAYSVSLTEPAEGDLPQYLDLLAAIPTASGGVSEWRYDRRGLYIGAVAYGVVLPSSTTVGIDYALTHHFTFSGIAVKNIGDGD